ncbi:MAG: AAA family ATPase [Cytophagaceae bacterium]|jgi:predicted ATPase/serine phosphatase RsbU (regulator of sigma subunit)/tRNA A-37 threonylcarbamoyl transferase component Bud32|nr:AAA family ATPase [Cytophagaceae bacterium]
MITLSELELIHESIHSDFYVTTDASTGRKLLYKIIKNVENSPEKKLELANECSILQKISAQGIRRLIEKTTIDSKPALLLEYIEGDTLRQRIRKHAFSLEEVYQIAIQLAETLDAIHQQNIIHKDISGNNIIVQPDGKIKIIDFGISTRTTLKNEAAPNINKLEGTLAYISPEQTGRMNRSVDYRTDFYSLGIVLYELCLGQVPFDLEDSLQMVYAHLAKEIPLLHTQEPGIPVSLSEIIGRLVKKNAEDRYQSAQGLLIDLKTSWSYFQQGKTFQSFPLGSRDHSGIFQIPEKSYGREKENERLLEIFELSGQGAVEMVLVEGPSGTGKSRLVAEINKPITDKRGFFIQGKFDQLQKDVPYSAFVSALNGLLQSLLSESEEKQEFWKSKLLKNLGGNGQLMVDLLPRLELLIGAQAAVPQLEGAASQNRFEYTLKQFIATFCHQEHPLVIFLDDLQWVDQASLRLIDVFLSDQDLAYLMLVCSYRDNEVGVTHPFAHLIQKLKSGKRKPSKIQLGNLSKENIEELLHDALHSQDKSIERLTNLVYSKSKGNIFFVHQYLNSISSANLFTFDHAESRWTWDIEKIEQLQVSENVVELMMSRIALLGQSTTDLLSMASCIGNSFTLPELKSISGKSARALAEILEPAIENGLLIASANIAHMRNNEESEINLEAFQFRFIHDRVQQTFYQSLSPQTKQSSHLAIGKLLLEKESHPQDAASIFEIVNHLNIGASPVQVSENCTLIQLNQWAGKKARNAAAFAIASQYFETAIRHTEESSWETDYAQRLSLQNDAAEAAYLCGNFELMESLVHMISAKARTPIDEAFAYEIRINAYNAQNKLLEQVQVGLEALKKLGVSMPAKPNKLHVVKELIAIKWALRGKKIESLADLPAMSNANMVAAHSIMTKIGSAAMYAAPDLLPIIAFRSTLLSIQYGNTTHSAFSYSGYAMILCGALGDVENGFKFGEVALTLASKTNDPVGIVRPVEIFYSSISHWKRPYREAIEPLHRMYTMGMESGDFEFAAYSINNYLFSKYFAGLNLFELNEENQEYVESVKTTLHHKTAFYHGGVYAQAAYHLMATTKDPWIFTGPYYNEAEFMPIHTEGKDVAMLCMAYYNKMTIAYYFGAFEKAEEYAQLCGKNLEGSISQPNVNLFYYFKALILLAQQKTAGVGALIKKVEKLAQWSPENFGQKFALLKAEWYRVKKNSDQANQWYNEALNLSKKHQYKNDEALTYELMTKFYLERDCMEEASHMIIKSIERYGDWGALAKIAQLKEAYGERLLTRALRSSAASAYLSTVTANTVSMDLESIVKASQSLSQEIKLEKLVQALMKIVFENAGAQFGSLLMLDQKKWMVQAIGTPDALSILPGKSFTESNDPDKHLLPAAFINYVIKTKEFLVLPNAQSSNFKNDPYFVAQQSKSVLCTPLLNQGNMVGLIYLENNLTTDTFTRDRIDTLNLLSSQIAISLENASLYNNLEGKVKERTEEVIKQKEIIEKKNKSITDSINYAKRIQEAVLPDMDRLKQQVSDAFVLFKPRDIVSGDFYWFAEKDGKLLIAAVDCTGHGVPGGFMSMVGYTLLQQMVFEREILTPGEILTQLNSSIRKELKQDSGTNKDGMDLAIVVLDKQAKSIQFAGAKNPLILVQDQKAEYIKGDKFPIGGSEHGKDFVFTTHAYPLLPNSYIYLYSDGYEDQLGGPDGRKFGRTRMLEMVDKIHPLPMQEQQLLFEQKHLEWKGKENQLDDLLLIGIKI